MTTTVVNPKVVTAPNSNGFQDISNKNETIKGTEPTLIGTGGSIIPSLSELLPPTELISGFNSVSSAFNAVSGINDMGSDALGGFISSAGGGTGSSDLRPRLSFMKGHPLSDYPGDMEPLVSTNGLVWPYRPTVDIARNVQYTNTSVTHSIADFYFFQGTKLPTITVSGDFSCANETEAKYLYASIRFLVVASRMSFGKTKVVPLGSPPPVIHYSGYGDFKRPVIINGVNLNYPNTVDYIITTSSKGKKIELPVIMNLSVTLQAVASANMVRNWSLEAEITKTS